jgi:hypothetical protein
MSVAADNLGLVDGTDDDEKVVFDVVHAVEMPSDARSPRPKRLTRAPR